MNRYGVAMIGACAGAVCAAASAQQYTLHVVEALSTFGIPEAYLFDVNSSGSATGFMTYTTAVPGGSYSTTYKGYRWSPQSGSVVYTDFPALDGINEPGDVVAGGAILWHTGGSTGVPALPGYPSVRASDINDNGLFVGASHWKSTSSASFDKAIYWTAATGTVDLSAFIPNARVAVAANNAGQIVGFASYGGTKGDRQAFHYDTNTGVVTDLNALLNGAGGFSYAASINEAGVVAGEGTHGQEYSAWTWEPSMGFTFLPGLGSGSAAMNRPQGINDAGEVVGFAHDGSEWRPYIWDKVGGMRDLNTMVNAPANFILDRAMEIADNGVIVGDGHWGPGFGFSVAWVMIPESPCYPDCDQSGSLDFFDFLCFQNEFASATTYADCDQSGTHDFFDFLCFQNAFAAGCP